jgi:hypothetical protein
MHSIDAGGVASSTELVADLATLAAELAAHPAPESGAACYEQVAALGRTVDLIESAIAARVAIATRHGQVAEWGHTSPTAWLRTSLDMRHSRAEERAVLASQLPRLPQVAKRLAAGDLSSGYATAIASGVRRLDEADCGKAEDMLLGFIDDGYSVTQITRLADKIKDLIAERDDSATEPEDRRRADRQWWALHRSGPGTFSKGHFGPELSALIKAKLEPLAKPCGAEDSRDHAERLADALQTFLSNGDSRWDPILIVNLRQPAWTPHTAERTPASTAGEPHVADNSAVTTTHGPPSSPTIADNPPVAAAAANTKTGPTPPSPAQPPPASAPAGPMADRPPAQAHADATQATAMDQSRQAGDSPQAVAAKPNPARQHQAARATTEPPRAQQPPTAAMSDGARGRWPESTHTGTAPPAEPTTAATTANDVRPPPGSCTAEADPGPRWKPWPPNPTWPFDGTPFVARLTDGTTIPMERARAILLNAGFSTLVLGTDGHPLYLGRRVRCATPAQRRVVLSRYSTCVVNGCEIPATGCQIDHVDTWENGQPTDIDRLVPCCAWHNRYKWRHPERITITQHADGRYHFQIDRPETHPQDRSRSRPTSRSSDRGP